MQKKIQSFVWAVTCAAGLSLLSAPAHAGGAKAAKPHIDKSAGNIQLIYPVDSQAKGEEGSIDFALYISAGGHPTGKYKIYNSTGYPDLDNAAVQSAMGWSYIPGTDASGDKVSAWIPIHLEYRLPQKPGSGEAAAKAAK